MDLRIQARQSSPFSICSCRVHVLPRSRPLSGYLYFLPVIAISFLLSIIFLNITI